MRLKHQGVELNIFSIYESVNNITINNLSSENFTKTFNKYIIKLIIKIAELNLKITKSMMKITELNLKIAELIMKIIKSDLNAIKSNLNAIKYLFIIFKNFN